MRFKLETEKDISELVRLVSTDFIAVDVTYPYFQAILQLSKHIHGQCSGLCEARSTCMAIFFYLT